MTRNRFRTAANRSAPPVFAAIQTLEPRRLLSASLENGVLFVRGSSLQEVILIREEGVGQPDGGVIVVEFDWPLLDRPSTHQEFPKKDVRSVVVRSFFGDDVVDLAIATYAVPALAGTQPLSLPSRVDGGVGHDDLYGGANRDVMVGGLGDDLMLGFAGDDWMNGGYGNDDMHGGQGDDFLFGANGNDRIGGDDGNDRMFGGFGNDRIGAWGRGSLPSEPGADFLSGGPGNDHLLGGEGSGDRILGGPGFDHFNEVDDEEEMLDRQPGEPLDPPPPTV